MGHDFKVTLVEVNFLNVESLLSLPTSVNLSEQQVDELISVGGELLDQSKAFNEFLTRIK